MSLVNPESLTSYTVYQHYCQHLKSVKPEAKTDPSAAIKTALFKYTLPGYGLPPNATKDEAINFLKSIPIHDLQSVLAVQQQVFDSLGVNSGIQRTNRSALRKMLEWCSSQPWWSSAVSNSATIPQPRKERRGSFNQVRVTKRKKQPNYILTEEEISLASALQVRKKPPVFLKPFKSNFQQWLLNFAVQILESLDD
jgi:hypothetical protein